MPYIFPSVLLAFSHLGLMSTEPVSVLITNLVPPFQIPFTVYFLDALPTKLRIFLMSLKSHLFSYNGLGAARPSIWYSLCCSQLPELLCIVSMIHWILWNRTKVLAHYLMEADKKKMTLHSSPSCLAEFIRVKPFSAINGLCIVLLEGEWEACVLGGWWLIHRVVIPCLF